ncbi:HTH-type transcriptional regulator PerR [Streptomyces sp. RB5]|uniref:HTH-type transcriptional regulator PerR n=1 Tax=Streptomyces smaragdinus TaxID=2585196 RepID=A0A7K0CMK6_9ACTN|nr:LysR family transcriptional regulator [Streptomyces smaragdinus]MQY14272.1 HTH-type transcriptional regulator PerR [Streptomyces smaragdinus]
MDPALLRTFVAVHRAGSLTRAAALLGLSQPAVTGQIRALERQLGRPLFVRGARGVTPTTLGEELAHKAAPHLDALLALTYEGPDAPATLHLAGPPEFLALRVLPALGPLVAGGLAVRAAYGPDGDTLEGLAAGRHDLTVTASRPRGGALTATPLWDEELVLVAGGRWAGVAPESVPVIEVHESLPFVTRYWAEVYGTGPAASAAVVVPDLRAALACAVAGAGLAVLPRYLCDAELREGRVVAVGRPAVPPIRTYVLSVRAGALALPHLARAHETLIRAATEW